MPFLSPNQQHQSTEGNQSTDAVIWLESTATAALAKEINNASVLSAYLLIATNTPTTAYSDHNFNPKL